MPDELCGYALRRWKTRQIQQIRLTDGDLLINVGRLTEACVGSARRAKRATARLVEIGHFVQAVFLRGLDRNRLMYIWPTI